tara:strand:- start:17314 stop:18063 length:750 start_codon:yes stop_codon:yes gene_type:complete
MNFEIHSGDCINTMANMYDESIDHCITDPPYEIGFMGNGWDNSGIAYNPDTWRAVHRILKKDGLLLAFGATRTHHRIAHAIERAGFEILDVWSWTFGTGFPKSQNIGKVLNKKGHEEEAEKWKGFGTALKPAWEPIIVARKQGSKVMPNKHKFWYVPKASKAERNEALPADMLNDHPTVKPITLMTKLIVETSEEGDTIFDPFMGSGSTGVAALRSKRNFVGCELTPEYIPIATTRLEKEIEKYAIHTE